MTSESFNGSSVPNHVAIIMDGNGRWAKQRGLPRIKGHENGAESVRAIIKACRNAGVKYLTLYAFSIENWVRPRAEITALMGLLKRFLTNEEHELHENKVRLRVTGQLADLPKAVQAGLRNVMGRTKDYQEGQLILALSYGGRREIAHAVREIARRVKQGSIDPEDVDEDLVSANLYLPDVPDPDLLIRTSGEMRLSNFLLWQVSYSELYVTDVLWPDFREEQFKEALAEYAHRNRRYGDIE
ncbi:MAG: isoprenyl transferase [Kiritimatiellia bacterium]|jgi:undecaprenyl diphosphate synthase|nr:isoprenyl transferase [Kiritimatiellia bacterium]